MKSQIDGRFGAVEAKIDALGQRMTLMFGVALIAVVVPASWRVLTP